MTQFSISRQDYFPNRQNADIAEMVMPIDQYGYPEGAHGMGAATKFSSFGEMMVAQMTPVIQLDGIYGLDPRNFQTYTGNGGSISTNNSLMITETGTSIGGYGVIRSSRFVRYRPGQGANARFTAAFTTPAEGYTQRAGFFSQEQAFQVGYDGTKFGILRQNGGKATIYTLAITAPASGAETVTITLNNVVFNINVTAGTIPFNCAQIGNAAFSGWLVEYNGDNIKFLSEDVGPKSGTFSVTSNGTFAGTMTQVQAGVNHTLNWTYQEAFNLDPLNGTGPSKIILDPTKLNVYQINFRWLGAGEIKFSIENPRNGDMIAFHHIHYTNRNTNVHVDNPSFKIGYVAASLGGSGSNIRVIGASMMGAIEGGIHPSSLPRSADGSRVSLNAATTQYHMLTLKNRLVLNNKINTKEIKLKAISAGMVSAAGVPARVKLYYNVDMAANLEYTAIDEQWSSAYVSKTQTFYASTGDSLLYEFILSPGAAETIDLEDLRIVIPPNGTVSVIIQSSGNMSAADVSLTWMED